MNQSQGRLTLMVSDTRNPLIVSGTSIYMFILPFHPCGFWDDDGFFEQTAVIQRGFCLLFERVPATVTFKVGHSAHDFLESYVYSLERSRASKILHEMDSNFCPKNHQTDRKHPEST